MEADQTLEREDVLTMLGACPERVRDYVMGLDESRLAYRHGPAFPTLRELVLHVSETGSAADTPLRHACLDGASEVDARAALAAWLGGCSRADEAILVLSPITERSIRTLGESLALLA